MARKNSTMDAIDKMIAEAESNLSVAGQDVLLAKNKVEALKAARTAFAGVGRRKAPAKAEKGTDG